MPDSSYPTEGFIDITVDVDPNWINTTAYGGTTYGAIITTANPWLNTTGSTLAALFTTAAIEGITEDTPVRYADIDVPGRAETYKTYMGTTNKEIRIPFQWAVQTDGDSDAYAPGYGVMWARWLDLMKQPVYDIASDLSYAPPTLVVRVGSLLVARCILTGGSPRWSGPFDPDTMYPYRVDYNAVFTVVRSYSGDYSSFQGAAPDRNTFVQFQSA